MTEAILYDKLPGSRIRCNVCQWRCAIGPGKTGVCKARRNDNGILQVLNYAEVTSANADPIECADCHPIRIGSDPPQEGESDIPLRYLDACIGEASSARFALTADRAIIFVGRYDSERDRR